MAIISTKYDILIMVIVLWWISRVWYWIGILIFQYLKQGLNSSIIGRLIQHIYEHASVPHTSFNDLFDMVTGGDGWSKDQSIRAMALQSIICVTQRIYYNQRVTIYENVTRRNDNVELKDHYYHTEFLDAYWAKQRERHMYSQKRC